MHLRFRSLAVARMQVVRLAKGGDRRETMSAERESAFQGA